MKRIALLSCLPFAALAACAPDAGPEPPTCTADERPGVEVEVGDARTGLYITPIAVVVAREGTYADTLRPGRLIPDSTGDNLVPASLSGLLERPGTYSIEASAPGYRPAVRTGVVVARGECHVGTNRLLIELEKHEPASRSLPGL